MRIRQLCCGCPTSADGLVVMYYTKSGLNRLLNICNENCVQECK